MGINFFHIRQVIYLGPSDNIESYIQETGRSGLNSIISLSKRHIVTYAHEADDTILVFRKVNLHARDGHMLFHIFEGYKI